MNVKRRQVFGALAAVLLVGFAALSVWARHIAFSDTPYNATKAQLASLEMKLRVFHLDTQTLPKNLQGLLASDGSQNWRGPYAKSTDLTDPWGRAIQYEAIDATKPRFRLSVLETTNSPSYSVTYEP
jgi:general secretion pathway protein G